MSELSNRSSALMGRKLAQSFACPQIVPKLFYCRPNCQILDKDTNKSNDQISRPRNKDEMREFFLSETRVWCSDANEWTDRCTDILKQTDRLDLRNAKLDGNGEKDETSK